MREIKFRVWESFNKKMDYLDFALYSFDENSIHTHKFVLPFEKQGIQNPYTMMNLDTVEVMQYTGLKDKKGTEIYENDILKITCKFPLRKEILIDKIEWLNDYVSFGTDEWLIFELLKNTKDGTQEIEVIGNVYENPEIMSSLI